MAHDEAAVAAVAAVALLLAEAGSLHHQVFRLVDGDDPDWASWYADWLLDHSELPALLGEPPVRSHLVHALVDLGRAESAGPWAEAYARGLVSRFGAGA